MNNKKLIFGMFFLVSILFLGMVSSQEQSICCEKNLDGAWCQNEESIDNCDSTYKTASTHCDSTGEDFCKRGTCIDGEEGICSPNTPRSVCETKGGYWENKPIEEISQCRAGCCFLGESTSFITQTRCTTLSAYYGLETNFRGDIQNLIQCIASSNPSAKGACVIEQDYVRDCEFTTKENCNAKKITTATDDGLLDNLFGGEETSGGDIISVDFHENYLCSAESLGAICGPSKKPNVKTRCENGKVYFVDTCDQLANIYDASKVDDKDYWTYLKDPEESCGYNSLNGNANSKTCGNCDYSDGSVCQSFREGDNVAPRYGDYVCGDLSCEYEGETYQHGESWCVTNTKEGLEENLPGTEHYKLDCHDGEVTYEECSRGESRNKICLSSEVNEFRTAQCKANPWHDCVGQITEEFCLDKENRYCEWIPGFSILKDEEGKSRAKDENNDTILASCVPEYAPAFNFWSYDGDGNLEGAEICSLASNFCVVEFEVPASRRKAKINPEHEDYDEDLRNKWCVKNCECLPDQDGNGRAYPGGTSNCESGCRSYNDWISNMKDVCHSLGDCGNTLNAYGKEGYFDRGSLEEDTEVFIVTKFWKKAKDVEGGLE